MALVNKAFWQYHLVDSDTIRSMKHIIIKKRRRQMNTEQELAIDYVTARIDALNNAIKEANKAGLEVKVIIEAYCDIRVDIKEGDYT